MRPGQSPGANGCLLRVLLLRYQVVVGAVAPPAARSYQPLNHPLNRPVYVPLWVRPGYLLVAMCSTPR